MSKKVFLAFFKLVRLDYSLFGSLTVFLSGFLVGNIQSFQFEYLIAFLIVFFSAVGSFAFNDYFDFEIDKRNKRIDRPLVLGLLPKKLALITGLLSFLLIVFFSLFLNLLAMFMVLLSLPLFYFYSLNLKKFFLVKNLLIAYSYVATLLLSSFISDLKFEPVLLYFALMGFIVGLANEIMFDIGDVEGDKKLGVETISTKYGIKIAAKISTVLYSVIIILDPLPFFLIVDARLYFDYFFLLLILIPVISYFFISKSLLKDQSKENILKLNKNIFFTMLMGCVAYLIGVLL